MRDPIRPKSPPTPPPPPPPDPGATGDRKRSSSSKTVRAVLSMLRSFPIIPSGGSKLSSGSSSRKTTCTLYGHKKGHVSLSLQDSPGCLPSLVLELPVLTHTLHKELRSGTVRVSLVCDKKPPPHHGRCRLMEERVWSAYWNGKENGLGVPRDANEADLNVMKLLKVVSMGVGAVPAVDGGEVAYIRATFEHVVGSKDSETLYMLTPEGKNAPELTIVFVRSSYNLI